jgi:Mn-containing catalase
VNGLLNGIEPKGDMSKGEPSFAGMFSGAALKAHVAPGPHAGVVCADSLGNPWKGDYIFNSGNLILDLLHNFFLENGARTAKLRAYQLTTNPAARRMLGYLFTRGGVHATPTRWRWSSSRAWT